MGYPTCNRRRARQPRYCVDGLPFEIFETDEPGTAYLVTEPGTNPVGYLFRIVEGHGLWAREAVCESIDENVKREDLANMELLDKGKSPTMGTDVGVVMCSFMHGLIGASVLAGRPADEGFNHDEPKPTKKRKSSRAKSIRY